MVDDASTDASVKLLQAEFPGIRAALCQEDYSAKMSRLHNDANMLVLPGRIINVDTARAIVKTWFTTSFEGGRHQRRLDKIKAIESRVR